MVRLPLSVTRLRNWIAPDCMALSKPKSKPDMSCINSDFVSCIVTYEQFFPSLAP